MTKIDADFQQLVIARLRAMPADISMSIGGVGTMTRDEMLKHVSDNDKIGEQIIDTEKSFFEVLKSGELYDLYATA